MFDEVDDADDGAGGVTPSDDAVQFGTPRLTQFLLGHEGVEQTLLYRAMDNILPQALLIAGPEGVGKATLAFRLARFLLAGCAGGGVEEGPSLFGDEPLPVSMPENLDVSAADTAVRLITAGAHPDFMVVEREVNQEKGTAKATIGAGQIRAIADMLHLQPSTPHGWRVVIIDDADTMTIEAQNSLLKMLEEPPPRSLFMLIAHRQGQLLPTIYSRVQKIKLGHLPHDLCRKILSHDPIWPNLSPDLHDVCLFLGNYTPGQVIRLLPVIQANGLDLILQDMQNFDHDPVAHAPTLIERVGGQQAADMPMFMLFERMLTTLTRLAATQAHGGRVSSIPASLQGLYDGLQKRHNPESLLRLYDALDSLFQKVRQQNLDRRAAVAQALCIWRGNG